MSERKILFVDRDGTLIREPADQQVDKIAKIELAPGVVPALLQLRDAGYDFVLVSNQDGLGTDSFPRGDFEIPHRFMLALFASQGIGFYAEFICPHFETDRCSCRKPRTGLLTAFLARTPLDTAQSFVIGDRDTDLALADNLGLAGIRVDLDSDHAGWPMVARRLLGTGRSASVERGTKETRIAVSVNLDAPGSEADISTGIGFFDHMLEQLARHGGFGLRLHCEGDLHVDEHHVTEDCAIALGEALRRALGNKHGIGRYGFVLPMDESEAQVSIDLSGRPYFKFDGAFRRERVGGLATEMVPHFFHSLADSLRATLHTRVRGANDHHQVEALFKATGRCLRQAFALQGTELPSTKGML